MNWLLWFVLPVLIAAVAGTSALYLSRPPNL